MRWLLNLGRKVFDLFPFVTWVKLKNDSFLKVDLSNTVGRSIWLRKEYGLNIERLIKSKLNEGSTFIDVGANCGYFSIVAASLVGNRGRVISFEPNPSVASLINDSKNRNRLNNVQVETVALSDKSGKSLMQIQKSSGISYLGDFSRRKPEDKILKEIEVPLLTLDEFMRRENLNYLDLLKIDCEGAEMDILNGSVYTLSSFKPDLIIEIVPHQLKRFGAEAKDIFSLLSSLGYKSYDLDGNIFDIDFMSNNNVYNTDYFFSIKEF
jgi:FkbM family methyltransferase